MKLLGDTRGFDPGPREAGTAYLFGKFTREAAHNRPPFTARGGRSLRQREFNLVGSQISSAGWLACNVVLTYKGCGRTTKNADVNHAR